MQVQYSFRLLRNPKDINWGSFLLNADADITRGIRRGRAGWHISFEGIANRTRFLHEFGHMAADECRKILFTQGGF